MEKGLSFDDVYLVPQYSMIRSRAYVDTSVSIGGITLRVPIMSAGMDSVTGVDMAIAMYGAGGVGVLHRFNSTDDAKHDFNNVMTKCDDKRACMVSVGVGEESRARAIALYDEGATMFVIDIAHGHSVMMKEQLEWLRSQFKTSIWIMAGNVATFMAVRDLREWGADVVKVGVGPGAVCQTRVVTGHGIPQFSCILECSKAGPIVADGGIRSSGDIVKALAAGAQAVMVGSLLAGTIESEAQTIHTADGWKKRYSGMASSQKTRERKIGKSYVPAAEGVDAIIPIVGHVSDVMDSLHKGIQSGLSYTGANNVISFRNKAMFDVQTNAGYREGTPYILDR